MTVNGIGTLYYGWKPLPDGSAEATCWFVVAFLPLIPLRRERIRIYSTAETDTRVPIVAGASQTAWQIVERLPLSWSSVILTYVKGFVIVPAILFVPVALVVAGVYAIFRAAEVEAPAYLMPVFAIASIVYFGVVIAFILDGAKGRHIR